ncbi:MAG: acetyl-CoA carboxylase biotin carboxyl carrier protein [Rubrivivax sp.]|nr:acetyl-CoA carboxylase biotin carboxyl carrier protein [Rubrivivax sp.]
MSVSATGPLGFADIAQIVELLRASSQFSEFRLKVGELELEVRRGATSDPLPQTTPPVAAAPVAAPAPAAALAAPTPAPAASAPAATATPSRAASSGTAGVVVSPMVGTFYAAPEPGSPPFVTVGRRVEAGDALCIIEVMKLMNTLRAERAGIVAEILVRDAESVEYGQPLMRIEPA